MRARRNETTGKILAFLSGSEEVLVKDVSQKLRLGNKNAAATLDRLFRQRCVTRQVVQDGYVMIDEDEGVKRPNRCYAYAITEKGKTRLQWILGQQTNSKGRR